MKIDGQRPILLAVVLNILNINKCNLWVYTQLEIITKIAYL
jgi:hypothetical protein